MRAFSLAVVVVATAAGVLVSGQTPVPSEGSVTFRVFAGTHEVGNERVAVSRSATGSTITATGSLGGPFSLTTRRFEARYDATGKPLELTIDANLRGALARLHTTFKDGSAVNEVVEGTQQRTVTHKVSPEAVILPNSFFAAYEGLAARLSGAKPGLELPVYVAPQAEITVRVSEVSEERIATARTTVQTQRIRVAFGSPGGSIEATIWVDDHARLVRVHIPAGPVEVVREDVATVSARAETISRAGDEAVNINAAGFNLAATVSKPTTPPGRSGWPAVMLVPGSGPVDRDETISGIPVLGQIASALADAGFLVIRYDKRGVGQSGGRTEVATLTDYAEDTRAVVRYLNERKDVDDDRIGAFGHSEGAWVALIAASKEKKIASLVLAGAASGTGADLILEQQRNVLDRMNLPDQEKQEKIALQQKIQAAVVSGKGWEGIPPELRQQADTPWFQSLLVFDPARLMRNVRQPVLILHGELDRQAPVQHADKLAELARMRKNGGRVDVEKLPGLNHLFVTATSGEVSEYPDLKEKSVNGAALSVLVNWFTSTLVPKS